MNHNQTGYYFEKFPSNLPIHAKANKKICVLAVNSNTWFWIKSLFKGKFNKKELTLVSDIEKKLPPVQGDIMRLEQVLINIIDNALKYTDKGEIKVSLKRIDNNIVLWFRIQESESNSIISREFLNDSTRLTNPTQENSEEQASVSRL